MIDLLQNNERQYIESLLGSKEAQEALRQNPIGMGGKAKAVGKYLVQDSIDQYKQAANLTKGWDEVGEAFGESAFKGLKKTGGKVFTEAVPVLGDVVDFGLRVNSGENVARAGIGTAASMGDWTIGSLAGAALGTALIPIPGVGTAVGGILGGLASSMFARPLERTAIGAYEAVTEDNIEKARKAAEAGQRPTVEQGQVQQGQQGPNAEQQPTLEQGQVQQGQQRPALEQGQIRAISRAPNQLQAALQLRASDAERLRRQQANMMEGLQGIIDESNRIFNLL